MKNGLDTDANILQLARVLNKLGLISSKTYSTLGTYLLYFGQGKKNAWRQANWKDFLKSG